MNKLLAITVGKKLLTESVKFENFREPSVDRRLYKGRRDAARGICRFNFAGVALKIYSLEERVVG